MSIVLSHPTGNANVRAAAAGFLRTRLLADFHTTIAAFPRDFLYKLGKLNGLKEIHRREYDASLASSTKLHPWRELGRLVLSKTSLRSDLFRETHPFSIDSVYQALDQNVADQLKSSQKQGVTSVYGYDDGAVYSFREAKRLGMTCLFDLPTGHWRAARRLLASEQERWPDWVSTMPSFTDSPEKLARKDEELRLADSIFVASQFTARTLREFPEPLAPIHVIPYGFPPVVQARDYTRTNPNAPIKLLFVGKLSQQKGIADLFAAVESIGKRVSLTVVGNKVTHNCAALGKALARHRWIPSLAHADILTLMREHDVLVFPSLFDGFGLVITEAMSQGTPVIASDRCAGPDLIEHGQNGWLIEAASTLALKEAIEVLIANPHQLAEVGKAAQETARKRPWEVYGNELAQAILEQDVLIH